MKLAYVLIFGTVAWLGGELLRLTAGGFNDMNSVVITAAFGLIALGIWVVWRAKKQTRTGRVGVAMVSLGMVLFALVQYQTIGSGIINDTAHASNPLFLAAGGIVSIGVVAMGFWIIRISNFPKWIGIALLVGTAISLGVVFIPGLVDMQTLSNIMLATALMSIGLFVRRTQHRRKTVENPEQGLTE